MWLAYQTSTLEDIVSHVVFVVALAKDPPGRDLPLYDIFRTSFFLKVLLFALGESGFGCPRSRL